MARLAGAGDEATGELWYDLGRASVELGRFAEAVSALTNAVGRGAGDRAETELAMMHALRGEPLRAMDELRDVLTRNPAFGDARVRLAWLMLAEGRETEVLELLAGDRLNRQGRAARSFALLRRGELEAARAAIGPDVARGRTLTLVLQLLRLAIEGEPGAVPALALEVAALAEDAGARPEHRVEAYFQLGALSARDQPDLAFRHWRSGHEILRRAQPFSRRDHAALLQATVVAWGTERFEGARGEAGPVFIVGLPRSGTTLAEHILSAHPDVHGAGERMGVLEAAGRLGGSVLDPESPRRVAGSSQAALAAEGARYLAGLGGRARVVLDKMPANDMQLGLISAMLPGARVIHCRRDLRATGFSIYRRHLSGYHPYAHDLGNLGWWMTAQRRLMAHWASVLPVPMLELNLEDWQRDFRGTLARVLAFLGLPYDAACERFHLQERVVRTASRDQVRRPVGAGEDWRPYEAWLGAMIAEL